MINNDTHSTNDEILFIESIGKHLPVKIKQRNIPKLTLLNNYAESLKKRVKWNNMDKSKILACVKSEIAKAEIENAISLG